MSMADVLKLPNGRQALGMSVAPAPTKRRGVLGKWEASFRDTWLAVHPEVQAGAWVRFEPITLTLYDGSSDVRKARYTPDFMVAVTRPDNAIRLYAFEVKGQRRQAGIVRLKCAAAQYPFITFALATGGPGRWDVAYL